METVCLSVYVKRRHVKHWLRDGGVFHSNWLQNNLTHTQNVSMGNVGKLGHRETDTHKADLGRGQTVQARSTVMAMCSVYLRHHVHRNQQRTYNPCLTTSLGLATPAPPPGRHHRSLSRAQHADPAPTVRPCYHCLWQRPLLPSLPARASGHLTSFWVQNDRSALIARKRWMLPNIDVSTKASDTNCCGHMAAEFQVKGYFVRFVLTTFCQFQRAVFR